MIQKDVIVIGGGAAGFFAALNSAEKYPNKSVCILERGKTGLQKVKISGGGRCNVTHAEFIPSELITNYPRGEKELLGPFHHFMTGDTMAWFEKRGVKLKIEEDGRIFPVTDSSQTIIDCFLKQADINDVDVIYASPVTDIRSGGDRFTITTTKATYSCENLIIASGSSSKMWRLLEKLGHTIISPVPSLFTFDISDDRIKDIPGVVAQDVEIKVLDSNLVSDGPLLITHVGLSAPSVLKLSAFGALELAERNYKFNIGINFIKQSLEFCLKVLNDTKLDIPRKTIATTSQFGLPKRLWRNLVKASGMNEEQRWSDVTKVQLLELAKQLTAAVFEVKGKSTFKEEFVTAGGVNLREIDFRTFESKLIPNLYFAGEVINVDAVTGGFNFQNAWTGAYIVSQSLYKS